VVSGCEATGEVEEGVMAEDERELEEDEGDQRQSPPVAQGGMVYGIGLIGALVWFWRQADGPEEHVLGVLKATVWPAFLVYAAFEFLHGEDAARELRRVSGMS
jgi:hypothetical protein